MLKLAILGLTVATLQLAHAESKSQKVSRKTATVSARYYEQARQDIRRLLSQKLFSQQYSDYTIDSIRQGEIGDAQAYFVRLVKPFSKDSSGMCFVFIGTDKLQNDPHACDRAE